MKVLSKSEILGALDLPTERVEVPEWGGAIFIRPLTAAEQDRLQRDPNIAENVNARLACLCIVDETGAQLFTEDDVEALGKKSAAAMARVVQAMARVNAATLLHREEISKN